VIWDVHDLSSLLHSETTLNKEAVDMDIVAVYCLYTYKLSVKVSATSLACLIASEENIFAQN
jgi:hypothetical protein